jgi:hypothetical protein
MLCLSFSEFSKTKYEDSEVLVKIKNAGQSSNLPISQKVYTPLPSGRLPVPRPVFHLERGLIFNFLILF